MKISPISSAFTAASSVDSKPRTLEETSYVKNLDTGFDTVSFEGKGLQRAKAGAAAVLVATTMAASSPPPAKADATPPATAAGEVVPGNNRGAKVLPDARDIDLTTLNVNDLYTEDGVVYMITAKTENSVRSTPAPRDMLPTEMTMPFLTEESAEPVRHYRPELKFDENKRANLEEALTVYGKTSKIDVSKAIKDVYGQYGEFLNENITEEFVKMGIYSRDFSVSQYFNKDSNPMAISPEAVTQVNNFLKSKGLEPLDPADPGQALAIYTLGVSQYYNPDIEVVYRPYFDVATAAGKVRASDPSDPNEVEEQAVEFLGCLSHFYGVTETNLSTPELIEIYGVKGLLRIGVHPGDIISGGCVQNIIDELGVDGLLKMVDRETLVDWYKVDPSLLEGF